jgi:hypothetical protein
MEWEAEYSDGSILKQYEGSYEHSSAEVDRDVLVQFRMLQDGEVVFRAFFDQEKSNKRLIFRRRNRVSATGELLDFVYLVGWHENVKGVSIKSICYVYSDGHIEFDDDRNDLQLFPFEQC